MIIVCTDYACIQTRRPEIYSMQVRKHRRNALRMHFKRMVLLHILENGKLNQCFPFFVWGWTLTNLRNQCGNSVKIKWCLIIQGNQAWLTLTCKERFSTSMFHYEKRQHRRQFILMSVIAPLVEMLRTANVHALSYEFHFGHHWCVKRFQVLRRWKRLWLCTDVENVSGCILQSKHINSSNAETQKLLFKLLIFKRKSLRTLCIVWNIKNSFSVWHEYLRIQAHRKMSVKKKNNHQNPPLMILQC